VEAPYHSLRLARAAFKFIGDRITHFLFKKDLFRHLSLDRLSFFPYHVSFVNKLVTLLRVLSGVEITQFSSTPQMYQYFLINFAVKHLETSRLQKHFKKFLIIYKFAMMTTYAVETCSFINITKPKKLENVFR